MNMSPLKLACFRLFLVTLGRSRLFSKLLKKVLIKRLILGKNNERYVATSNFFSWDDLK